MLTIATVQTANYCGRGAEYLEKLYAGVRRNLTLPWRGVCLTDDPNTLPKGIDAIKAEFGPQGYWHKLELFKKGAFDSDERVLFIDLDTIITGNIDQIASYDGPFAILEDVYFQERMASSLMAWRGDSLTHIWDNWVEMGSPMGDHKGDQGWIENQMRGEKHDIWQDLYPRQICSFKKDARPINRLPIGCRVLMYHGVPRPHASGVGWAQQLWDKDT